jgi:hypothetical protein
MPMGRSGLYFLQKAINNFYVEPILRQLISFDYSFIRNTGYLGPTQAKIIFDLQKEVYILNT